MLKGVLRCPMHACELSLHVHRGIGAVPRLRTSHAVLPAGDRALAARVPGDSINALRVHTVVLLY